MPRPRKTDRPVEKNISLPTSTVARVELELFSELEGKVPFGAWQKFLVGLIDQHFARKRVFVAQGFPRFFPVGTAAVIVAEDAARALALLNQQLYAKGLAPATIDCLRELPIDSEVCVIQCDGDY